jgi:hypothetical protein
LLIAEWFSLSLGLKLGPKSREVCVMDTDFTVNSIYQKKVGQRKFSRNEG